MKTLVLFLNQSWIFKWAVNLFPASDPVLESQIGGRFFSWEVLQKVERRIDFKRWSENFFVFLMLALLFSALFIPRFSVSFLGGTYVIDFRLEDLCVLLLAAFFPLIKRLSGAVPSQGYAVERYFLFYLIASAGSIFYGISKGSIDKPLISFLYLLKWTEFYVIFAAVFELSRSPSLSRLLIRIFWLAGILLALYGYGELWFHARPAGYPDYYRLFERYPFHGDANHIGGVLVLWMGFFGGFLLTAERPAVRALLFLSMLFVFFPFLWTLSRKSYVALAAAILSGIFFCKEERKKIVLGLAMVVLIALCFPTGVADRLRTFAAAIYSPDPYASSWTGNLIMWDKAFWNFDKFFIVGSGLGSRHRLFYESQYVMTLTETGIVGMAAYLALMFSPLRAVLGRMKKGISSGAFYGYGMAWIGIMVHSLSCVSLTVVKVAVPFWMLTGVLLGMCDQKRNERFLRD